MKGHTVLSLAMLLLVSGATLVAGVVPRVVATRPVNGDQDVAVTVSEIVVTFDQDMERSRFSFVGGGATFPKVTGRPVWRSARECGLPVKLGAGQSFVVGINSATKSGFRSTGGAVAKPFALAFKTGAPVEPAADMQATSVRQLREALKHRYSYREVHGVDWASAWRVFEPQLTAAKSAREFAVVAGEMLSATKDAHIWLVEGGEVVPAFRRRVTPNANVKLLPRVIGGWVQKHPLVATGMASPEIGYIAVHSWERKHAPQLPEAAFAALSELQQLPAIIVDVRFNSGGDEAMAREFAGCFIRDRTVYARHASLDPASPTGFSAALDRSVSPTPNRPAFRGRAAVLMGPVNMSSAEAYLLMMKQAPGCKLIGERSYGASGNPQPYLLANGVTVYLPSWQAMHPDGTVFEIRGIEPDINIDETDLRSAEGDPVIAAAVRWLQR